MWVRSEGLLGPVCSPRPRGWGGRGHGGLWRGHGVSAPDQKLIPPRVTLCREPGELHPHCSVSSTRCRRHPREHGKQQQPLCLQRRLLQTWDFSRVPSPWPHCAHRGPWAGKVLFQPSPPAVNELRVRFPIKYPANLEMRRPNGKGRGLWRQSLMLIA